MTYLKQFILPVKGLALGRSSFNYNIGNGFFEQFENSEIRQASISLLIELNKQSSMLTLEFKLKGTVLTQCDRCLDDFNLEIEGKHSLYLKYGKDESDRDDEIIFLSDHEHELDISQFIFEFIHLSLPIKKVHGVDKKGKSLCNKEMLSKISNYTIEDENKSDPRWYKLKDLM